MLLYFHWNRLDERGIRCSMSRPGQCLDNAAAESFFHTLKSEWIYHAQYETRREARLSIFGYIEAFYNTIRSKRSTNRV
jgi:putative transposase